MNQMDTALQIALSIISILQLMLAAFALLLDPRNRNNRYLAAHLTLLAVIGYSASQLSLATDVTEAQPWSHILGATTLAIGPALFIVTLSLLRPDDWKPTQLERWAWRFAHLLLVVPIVLILKDALSGTTWLYTGLDAQTYAGGSASTDTFLQGTAAGILVPLNLYLLSSIPLLLIVLTLWRDRQATSVIRSRARWLLLAQLAAMVIQMGTQGRVNPLVSTASTDLVVAGAYTVLFMRGLVSDAALTRFLSNVPLRPKLNISLGASLIGLLIISAVITFATVATQQQVQRALDRQRQLVDLTSEINSTMLSIQNGASEFYDSWTIDGFEDTAQGGFQGAKRIHLDPLLEELAHVRELSNLLHELAPDPTAFTAYQQIVSQLGAHEQTLLQMSKQMESLGYRATGYLAQLRDDVDELEGRFDRADLASLKAMLLQMSQQERDFFLRPNLSAARQTEELNKELEAEISAADDAVIPLRDKTRWGFLLKRYRDNFLPAADTQLKLQSNRANLAVQTNVTNELVSGLLKRQQTKFDAAAERLKQRQTSTTLMIIGLALLTLFASTFAAYFIVDRVIQPVRALGETVSRLGGGDLAVRADVHGHDEIGATASAINLMADRLAQVLTGLEQEVAERTKDLTRRTAFLEASAEVGRVASSILATDELLRQVVELIRGQFDLYYVGLFLCDEGGEWAVLRAGTGAAGQAMLTRGHRIHVGEGMIGWSVANAEARVASEVDDDAVRVTSAELPETRSEAAIPLRSRGQVLGALTVQDRQPSAFDEAALAVLQSMADQVAVALDNARLYTASLEALETARRAYGEMNRQAWTRMIHSRSAVGFRSDALGISRAVETKDWGPEMEQAFQFDQLVQGQVLGEGEGDDGSAGQNARHPLAVPIRVHGQVVGVIDTYKSGENDDWTPEELAIVQEISDHLALALDSARLHQDAQLRATREQMTSEIAAQFRETLDVETVLRTAVDEIYEALQLDELSIYLSQDIAQGNGEPYADTGPGNNAAGSPPHNGGRDA